MTNTTSCFCNYYKSLAFYQSHCGSLRVRTLSEQARMGPPRYINYMHFSFRQGRPSFFLGPLLGPRGVGGNPPRAHPRGGAKAPWGREASVIGDHKGKTLDPKQSCVIHAQTHRDWVDGSSPSQIMRNRWNSPTPDAQLPVDCGGIQATPSENHCPWQNSDTTRSCLSQTGAGCSLNFPRHAVFARV